MTAGAGSGASGREAARPLNALCASLFRQCADLLSRQDANPFRIDAYRRAAETLDGLPEDVRAILARGGTEGLCALPGIGKGLASSIQEIADTGRFATLDRLLGAADPEAAFRRIPGIGPGLARAIHDRLHIDSLEQLEEALADGRLSAVPGFGERRLEAVRHALGDLLRRRGPRGDRPEAQPPAEAVLDVDREYREKAEAGLLPKVAPRRLNPTHQRWLPILHTTRGEWHFTALYSNTARAHELGRTHDWVVIYAYDGDHRESQHTVVTETHGRGAGQRVVRGREAESRAQGERQLS